MAEDAADCCFGCIGNFIPFEHSLSQPVYVAERRISDSGKRVLEETEGRLYNSARQLMNVERCVRREPL